MNILISIIVPIYNMKDYIHRCVDSILCQTHHNLEIILVDDGSTDGSTEICEEYSRQDPRIKVIHKTNGGQGSARNIALEIAQGVYIGFVDSDDWIANDMYDYLLKVAEEEQADIVECGWTKVDINGNTEYTSEDKFITLTNKEAMYLLVYGKAGITTSVCNKLFKNTCIGFTRFPEVRAYEDDEFIHKVVWAAHKIVITGITKYFYFSRPESTMTAGFNANKLALLTVQRGITDFLKENSPEFYYKAQKTLCSKMFYLIALLQRKNNIEDSKLYLKLVESQIFESYNSFKRNHEMGCNKVILFIYRVWPALARMIIDSKFKTEK